MRDILFKAKRIDNGDWVEGYLLHEYHDNEPVIVYGSIEWADGWDLQVYYLGDTHYIRTEEIQGAKKYIWGFEIAGYEEENGRWLMGKEQDRSEMSVSVFANRNNEEVAAFVKKVRATDVRITIAPGEVTTYTCVLEYEGENPWAFLDQSR